MTKIRKSNFELLRILSIVFVLGCHANFFSLGRPDPHFISNGEVYEFLRVFLQCVFIVCVNCFIFISGWFQIKNPIKACLSISYQYLFFSLLVGILFCSYYTRFSIHYFIESLKPGDTQWFIFAYLILIALSPILNMYLVTSSKKEQTIVLLLFLFLQLTIGWINDYILINNGLSVLFFIFIYILSSYLRQYGSTIRVFNLCKYWDILVFFSFVLIKTFWASFNEYTFLFGKGALFAYNSPVSILATIYLCLFFSKLDFQSKIVNAIAKSSFAVYLLHANPLFLVPIWVPFWQNIWSQSRPSYFLTLPIAFVVILFISFIFDSIRVYSWSKFEYIFKSNVS